MLLSSLEQIQFKSAELEQYATHGDLAARWLMDIHSFGDMQEGCKVVDLGAGNGVMGLGSLSLGASVAILVEADQMALKIAQNNAKQNPKWVPILYRDASRNAFPIQLRLFSVLDTFCLPLGSLWPPFCLPFAAFGFPCGAFWHPLASFGRSLGCL